MRKAHIRLLALTLALTLALPLLPSDAAVLAWGSRGEQVALVQQKLRQYGYLSQEADGVFGRNTYNAVIAFQRRNGLTPDGRVGSATAAALGISLTGGTLSAELWQETELSLLARLVSGEARGEPYVGQVAVAAVVLNRVASSSFPNTVSGVIYQSGAFSCVSNGSINNTPDSSCIRAALDALNGWDPTGGCLYYYNAKTAQDKWIFSRTVQTVIGNHSFAI